MPDIISKHPLPPEPRLNRIIVSAGQTRVELDGDNLSLNSPAIYDLIAKVLAGAGTTDPALIAANKTLQADDANLASAVASNQPLV